MLGPKKQYVWALGSFSDYLSVELDIGWWLFFFLSVFERGRFGWRDSAILIGVSLVGISYKRVPWIREDYEIRRDGIGESTKDENFNYQPLLDKSNYLIDKTIQRSIIYYHI